MNRFTSCLHSILFVLAVCDAVFALTFNIFCMLTEEDRAVGIVGFLLLGAPAIIYFLVWFFCQERWHGQ